MKYTIVPLSLDNIKDITCLYKAVFGKSITLSTVHKKFDTSYLGKSHFGHLAYYNEEPVAFIGAIPVLMHYKNGYELAAQYVDAMTMPNHTGKGLFTTLAKHTEKQLLDARIKFVWVFPNQYSEYMLFNKLDWKYVERMQGFKIKVTNIPLEKIVRKFDLTSTLYEKHLAGVFKKHKVNTIRINSD